MKTPDWRIECDTVVFEKIKSDESFHQILAFTRAVNGLQFVISAMITDAQDSSPTARRSRINSFLFGSAILYESLLLIEKMNKQFGRNEVFNQGLYTLLKDPVARKLRLTWARLVTLWCFTTTRRSSAASQTAQEWTNASSCRDGETQALKATFLLQTPLQRKF